MKTLQYENKSPRNGRTVDQFEISKSDAINIQKILNQIIDAPLNEYIDQLELDDSVGRVYKTYTTTGDFTLKINSSTLKNKGTALIPIVASGNTTTIDSSWIKYSGDDFDDTDGVVNHFTLIWTGEYFYWTNKVVTP